MRYKFRNYEFEPLHVSCQDWSFLRLAAKQASNSNHHRFKLGAVVVKSRSVLSQGVNIAKKSPDTPPQRESIHAEVSALKGAKNPSGSTMYVARLNSDYGLALAKPCEYCIQHMLNNGVEQVVFSINENEARSFYLASIEWKGYQIKNGTDGNFF
jgi:deoxycytidylate deaminase